MNEEIQLICYHGTSSECKNNILKEGFKESKAEDNHWLGRGIYFFENLYYAIEWGVIYFMNGNKYENYIQNAAIIRTVLNLENVSILDLNDPIGYIYYFNIIKCIKDRFPEKINSIKNENDIEIFRLLDEIENETGELYISEFDLIIAEYPKDIYKKGIEPIYGNFLPCIQKQICVKNSNIISQISEFNLNSSLIEDYFDIIIKNRKEINNAKQFGKIKKFARKNKANT